MKLSDLPNIGAHAEELLTKVGITTPEKLCALGAEQAWLQARTVDPGACLHLLYALEGAIQGIPKSHIALARKEELRTFFKHESA